MKIGSNGSQSESSVLNEIPHESMSTTNNLSENHLPTASHNVGNNENPIDAQSIIVTGKTERLDFLQNHFKSFFRSD